MNFQLPQIEKILDDLNTKTGADISEILEQLPDSVRSGQDEIYEVYQIRLNDLNSWENLMGTTTLIIAFLNIRSDEDACFLWPDFTDLHRNWPALLKMHNKYFPVLDNGHFYE
ncbi:hypothetical protein A2154_04680 [Candidatus Gottesmanbacteria bacterium RBG_16_43_7]|uniref:Uncharacterized protein n=1 Tax=Candidatus Gottesmanbacteria bacterium RBG_16_43_7 TaxID=1798373 RepID=A0A1F5Z8J6_9BACT|nr:MAG: hypothetical protein A2154_04680 [Candidatus Gottesmanbacteria bacterium RBG_16_43_7]